MKRSVQAAKMEIARGQVKQAIDTIAHNLRIEILPLPVIKRQSVRPLHEMAYFAVVLEQIADVTSTLQATEETDLFPELVAEPKEAFLDEASKPETDTPEAEPMTDEVVAEPADVSFPEDFPEAELLIEAGFTLATIPTTRDGLEAIDGIGPKKAALILEALEDGRSN